MIKKTGTQIWMDIQNKPINSKRYVSFTSDNPKVASEIFHFFARHICIIAEEENTKLKRFSKVKTSLKQQKYSISLIENSIKTAL